MPTRQHDTADSRVGRSFEDVPGTHDVDVEALTRIGQGFVDAHRRQVGDTVHALHGILERPTVPDVTLD